MAESKIIPLLGQNLTFREMEVAELVAEGLTNEEIAIKLNMSIQTVRNQTHSAFLKLGINNRVKLARWVWERDLLVVRENGSL
jgi:DNA-binding NarL/FixJ family response regulator